MKKIIFLVCLTAMTYTISNAQDTVKVYGHATDYDGNPIVGAEFALIDKYWQSVADATTDSTGYYQIHVPKGEYMAFTGMISDEYPRQDAVEEEDMRLEFWAWNIIADRDLEINPHYHRMELYGTTVFEVFGSYPGYFVYFRPMGVTKYLSYGREVWQNKEVAEKIMTDISIDPDDLEVEVYADGEKLRINQIQRLEEYVGDEYPTMGAYLLHVDRPSTRPDKPYIVFRVVAKDTKYNEKGENLYFYRIPGFYR